MQQLSSPPSRLLALPPELLLPILNLACTARPRGQTSHALHLTCKHLRELCVSTGVDLQVTFLADYWRAGRFAQMLETRRVPRLKSLFVAYGAAGSRPWHDLDRRYILPTILNLISPTFLTVLTIHHSIYDPTAPLLPLTFPRLTHLTLDTPLEATALLSSSPQPSLTHLHLHTQPSSRTLHALNHFSPHLIHLTLPGPNNDLCVFVHAYLCLTRSMREIAGPVLHSMTSNSSLETFPDAAIPTMLRCVVVTCRAFYLRPNVPTSEAMANAHKRYYQPLRDLALERKRMDEGSEAACGDAEIIRHTVWMDKGEGAEGGNRLYREVTVYPVRPALSIDEQDKDEAEALERMKQDWLKL
ncbi:hypothetical protein EIP91_001697 [Steccherinum ochraceum]|uniref:F-box domain-containing protein n=1 Tax=Steccherinum ochraceum TaxID=92696 RepID=A0A4R0RH76_9APHY|nr:hypothetical protein EIP91_001697 [Steccherinum ochraceum]